MVNDLDNAKKEVKRHQSQATPSGQLLGLQKERNRPASNIHEGALEEIDERSEKTLGGGRKVIKI